MPSGSGLDILRDGIGALRQRASDRRYYIDPHSLKGLCTPRVIEDAIGDCPFPPHRRDHIKDAVLANGIITFCILVYKRKEQFMTKFLECDVYNVGDTRLPLDEKALKGISEEAAGDFFEVQWEFRPVILARRRYMQINDESILPFDKDDHDEEHDGSFGAIHIVVIKSSMQKLIDTEVNLLIYSFLSDILANSQLVRPGINCQSHSEAASIERQNDRFRKGTWVPGSFARLRTPQHC